MTFELWDTESGNLLAVYPSKDAAVAFIKSVVATYGDDAVEQWELFEMGENERVGSVASGGQLAAIAHGRNPTAA